MQNVTDLQLETSPGIGQNTWPGTRVQCTKAHLYTNKYTYTHAHLANSARRWADKAQSKFELCFGFLRGRNSVERVKQMKRINTNALTLTHTLAVHTKPPSDIQHNTHTRVNNRILFLFAALKKKGRRLHHQIAAVEAY